MTVVVTATVARTLPVVRVAVDLDVQVVTVGFEHPTPRFVIPRKAWVKAPDTKALEDDYVVLTGGVSPPTDLVRQQIGPRRRERRRR